MIRNVGGIDRLLRIVVGLVLISLIFVVEGGVRWWGLVGLVPLLTGLFQTCPLYSVFGLNTCPLRNISK
ncbi:MAG: DUF2892 domain-containing protein [Bosea sp.]|jgi:hypothetical protein|uniref:YgaP family membrane protein n=1 Tax=Bosea sp. (in: a-proteobacteria) TaxID=1871050 RepID=UPI001AC76DE5|nr:DUF2892 domain-containing protein [Bosea sp. (in: a-proteobacteria)]MBN9469404.1 DUF2892 domain-containing protein [Bosea sp. (in: a-proteobacteria)]